MEPLLQRSQAALQAGQLQEAAAALEQARSIAPSDVRVWLAAARVLAAGGDSGEALKVCREALRLAPGSAEGHHLAGELNLSLGSLAEAESESAAAAKLDSKNVTTIRLQAVIAARQGKVEDAARLLEEAIQTEPQAMEAYMSLAALHLQTRRWDSARRVFELALLQQPGWPPAAIGLAQTLNTAGDPQAAVAVLRQAHSLRPDDADLRTALAWHLATNPDDRVRDGPAAVALLAPLTSQPAAARIDSLEALAAAHAESGRFEDALSISRVVVERLLNMSVPPEILMRARGRVSEYEAGRPIRDRASPP